MAVTVSVVMTIVGLGLIAAAMMRRDPREWTPAAGADAALAAVLVLVTTSRVLSPQYLIWLLGVAAVCLTMAQTRQRPAVLLILAATALTHMEFPVLWKGVLAGEHLAVVTLAVRNVLLAAATVLALTAVWRRSPTSEKNWGLCIWAGRRRTGMMFG